LPLNGSNHPPYGDVEAKANIFIFLEGIAADEHRVLVMRPYWDGDQLAILIDVTDTPHPHNL
jgi:hypothetical protein